MACLLATSCAGGVADVDEQRSTPDTAAPVIASDTGPAPSVELDVLRLALNRPDNFRPPELQLSDQAAVIVADLLYDGLTELVGGTDELRPALAVEWTANADHTEWTFLIDPDRATASEVVAAFEKLRQIEGNPAVTPLMTHVTEIEPVDSDAVRFVLDRPAAGFPWLVSGVGTSIVGTDGRPTGPYSIVSESEGQLVLEPRDEISGLPHVTISWADSNRKAYRHLTLGLVDGAVAPPELLAGAERRFGYEVPPRSVVRFLGMAPDSAIRGDLRARGAVASAIDRDRLHEQLWSAEAYRLDGLLPPTLAGYRPIVCGSPCAHDGAGAALAVAEIASENGRSVSLTVGYDGDDQAELVEQVAADLTAVGFDIEVWQGSASELLTAIVEGSVDVYVFGWLTAAGSADAVIPQLLGSSSSASWLGYGSLEVDALINEAATIDTDHDRWDLLHEAQLLAVRQGHLLPLAAASSQLVVAPQAAGLALRPDGSIDLYASDL